MNEQQSDSDNNKLVRRHLQFAWWSLLCYLSLGVALEALHALKVGWYLESAYETRRLMWTLGHAHGTLLALVHVVFGITLHVLPGCLAGWRRYASPCLMAASVLLPNGFFLGGIFIYGGDPGVGVWLVPLGAAALFTGVLMTALGTMALEEAKAPTHNPQRGRDKKRTAKQKR